MNVVKFVGAMRPDPRGHISVIPLRPSLLARLMRAVQRFINWLS
jgi:hypothetical protein